MAGAAFRYLGIASFRKLPPRFPMNSLAHAFWILALLASHPTLPSSNLTYENYALTKSPSVFNS